jgi:c-di-GMP-binding flagellar brake protein YcgR
MILTADMFKQIADAMRTDQRAISDRRRYPRVGVRARMNIVPLNDLRQPMMPCSVCVRDVSAGGFGLLVAKPLPPGQLFVARLERGGEGILSLLCEVVCSYSNDRIGARILRQLESTSVLVKHAVQASEPTS